MFKVKMLCFDVGNPTPYEDEPCQNIATESYKEAYEYAYNLADMECADLNDDADENVSFGIVEEKNRDGNDVIRVNYYYMDGETDTTGNTEQVTVYWVERY